MQNKSRSRFKLVKVNKNNNSRFQEIDFSFNLMQYITGHALSTDEVIERYSYNMDHKYFGAYFVEKIESNEIIGLAVIKEKGREAEIGYMVLDKYKGNGIATEINLKLIEVCRQYLPAFRICAYVDKRNMASIRVLEKSGMKKDKTINSGSGIVSIRFLI